MQSAKMIKRVQRGFTLIELMIVVAIIGILAAVAIPAYQDYVTKAKIAKVASATSAVQTAIAQYLQENGGDVTMLTASTPWTSLGLASTGPTTTTEVSGFALGENGVLTATLSSAVVGNTACTVAFAPILGAGATALKWQVTPATTCPQVVISAVQKWN